MQAEKRKEKQKILEPSEVRIIDYITELLIREAHKPLTNMEFHIEEATPDEIILSSTPRVYETDLNDVGFEGLFAVLSNNADKVIEEPPNYVIYDSFPLPKFFDVSADDVMDILHNVMSIKLNEEDEKRLRELLGNSKYNIITYHVIKLTKPEIITKFEIHITKST